MFEYRCCCAVSLVYACVYMSSLVCVCVFEHAYNYACLFSLRSAAVTPAAGKLKLIFMPELDACSVGTVGEGFNLAPPLHPSPHLQPSTTTNTSNKTIHC